MGRTPPTRVTPTKKNDHDVSCLLVYNVAKVVSKISTKIVLEKDYSLDHIYKKIAGDFELSEKELSEYILVASLGKNQFLNLEMSKEVKISAYPSIKGNINCELRFRPWHINFQLENGTVKKVELFPHLECSQVLKSLFNDYFVSKSELKSSLKLEDYGLFFFGKDSKDQIWLEDTEKLSSFALNKKEGLLTIKVKPKSIIVHNPFIEGTTETLNLPYNVPVAAMLNIIAHKLNVSAERVKEYALFVKNTNTDEGQWLEPNKNLNDYDINQMVTLFSFSCSLGDCKIAPKTPPSHHKNEGWHSRIANENIFGFFKQTCC